MSLFDPPLTFVNNDEDNYQQASDSDGDIDGRHGYSSLDKSSKNGKNGDNGDKTNSDNENENESSKTSVLTRTKSVSHHIRWEIDDRSIQIAKLATKADKRGVIEATVIKDGYDFKLELCASGWRSSQDGYCAFYLTVPNMTDTFVARYRVQFGQTSRVSSIRHDFQLGVGFPNFCHQDTLDSCLTNKICLFNIVIEIFNCESTIKLPLAPLCGTQPDLVLANLMRSIYSNRLHCDVKLVCCGKNIFAHKVVLSHASPVFKAMFSHNLYENNSNEVNMVEWDPCIVEAFIKYLYTAEIDIKKAKNNNYWSRLNSSKRHELDNNKKHHSNSSKNKDNNNLKSSINTFLSDNNHNNGTNASLLGLDEIDIDESKTWCYKSDIFEKKDNSNEHSDNNRNGNSGNSGSNSNSGNINNSSLVTVDSDSETDSETESEIESQIEESEMESELISSSPVSSQCGESSDASNTVSECHDESGASFDSASESDDMIEHGGDASVSDNDIDSSDNIFKINVNDGKDKNVRNRNRNRNRKRSKHRNKNKTRNKNRMTTKGGNDIIMGSNNNSNSMITTPERSCKQSIKKSKYLKSRIENDNDNDNNENDEKDSVSTSVIDAALNTVSIVDMSEQGVGSPCATRLRRVDARSVTRKGKQQGQGQTQEKRKGNNNSSVQSTKMNAMDGTDTETQLTTRSTNASIIRNRNRNENGDDSDNDNDTIMLITNINTNSIIKNEEKDVDICDETGLGDLDSKIIFDRCPEKERQREKEREIGIEEAQKQRDKIAKDKETVTTNKQKEKLSPNTTEEKMKKKDKDKHKHKHKRKHGHSKHKDKHNKEMLNVGRKNKKSQASFDCSKKRLTKRSKNSKSSKNNENNKNVKGKKNGGKNKNNKDRSKRSGKHRSNKNVKNKEEKYKKHKSKNESKKGRGKTMIGKESGRKNALSNDATFKLFEIAEFYKVTNLVIACCQKMHREIKVETACDLLIRIHRYDHVKELKQIQESVWIFVSNNIRTVMNTDGYKYILTHYPHLLGQLIEKITN